MHIQRIHFYGLLVVMFLAGAVLGTALDTMATRSQSKLKHMRISELVQQVDMTPDQRKQMERILDEGRQHMVALNQQFHPAFEKIRHQTRAAIRAVLNHEQREEFDRLLEARDKERRLRDANRQTSKP